MQNTQEVTEQQVRQSARRKGLYLKKSRKRVHFDCNDVGGFMLLYTNTGACYIGSRFDLSLADAAHCVAKY